MRCVGHLFDRVVHHALLNVIEPVFERSFAHDSYSCRAGKGTHRALDRFTHLARRYPWVLKTDISKYFPSIDHQILESALADLDEAAEFIARGSRYYAAALVQEVRDATRSLRQLAQRGRVVPEFEDPSIREIFVRSHPSGLSWHHCPEHVRRGCMRHQGALRSGR